MKLIPEFEVSNRLALVCGLFVSVWALLVLLSWHAGNLELARLYGPWEPMPYDAALGLLLCGAGLIGASLGSWRLAIGCSLVVGALAAYALAIHVFGLDPAALAMLIPAAEKEAATTGRMTANVTGALFLCGLMLVTIGYGLLQKVEGYAFASVLGLLVAVFGLLSLFSFFSTQNMVANWRQLTAMTPPVALGFTLLGLSAAVFRWPEDAKDNVNTDRLQSMVITYVSAGVLITMLFSAAIGLLPLYELVRAGAPLEVLRLAAGSDSDVVTKAELLDSTLRRQLALTGVATLLLAYIGGFGVWRLLRPLTGRILMRADALEKMIQKATEELEASVRNLQRSNRQLDQFARVASHDLQAPLHTISGFAQILADRYGPVLGDEGREFVGYITGGARQMQEQITGLLQLSRLNSRAEPMRAVDTGEVVSQVLTYLQSSIEAAGARVQHEGLPTVHGERAQLGLLFQNLVANAIKFRRPGVAPQVAISARPEDGHWRFEVRDNGIGIPPEHREAVFELFRRLHTQDEYPGTGIGLALCKDIVERHGGNIAVESQPGAGSVFSFTLPAASTQPQAAAT
ncbi:MAG TPA: ATP-binding protein [Nevskiales bacterium]|nr:ATP-binding protein [Nevskiales bacterium]